MRPWGIKERAGLAAVALAASLSLWGAWTLYARDAPPTNQPGPTKARPATSAVLPRIPSGPHDGILRGRVVDERGPVSGVDILATGGSRASGDVVLSAQAFTCAHSRCEWIDLVSERRGEQPPVGRAVSGPDGSFEIRDLADDPVTLWASRGNAVGMTRNVPAGELNALVELYTGATLHGRVAFENDEGAPAWVVAVHQDQSRFFEARANAKGEFAVGPLPRGQYAVVASLPGFFPGPGFVDLLRPARGEFKLKLVRPRTLSGVVTRGGQSAPGVTVDVTGAVKTKVVTDDQGEFRVEQLPRGTYRACVETEQAMACVSKSLSAPEEKVTLVLEPPARLMGVVRSPSEDPIPGARVGVRIGRDVPDRITETDAAGRFSLTLPKARFGSVSISAPGFERYYASVNLVPGETQTLDVELESTEAGLMVSVVGRVVSAEGAPISGAKVQGAKGPPAYSGVEGQFEFSLWPPEPGDVELSVSALGYQTQAVASRAPSKDVQVVLRRGAGRAQGVVFDEKGKPMAQASVVSIHESGARSEISYTGLDGTFALEGLLEGKHRLRVRALLNEFNTAYRTTNVAYDLTPQETAKLTVRFPETLTIAGVVHDRAGQPVPNAQVRASPLPVRGGDVVSGLSDARGAFTLEVREGLHYVRATREGFLVPDQAKVQAGQRDVVLRLDTPGSVSGRVVDAAGRPVRKFLLDLEPVENERGEFRMVTREGPWTTIVIQVDGFPPVRQKVKTEPGAHERIPDIVVGVPREASSGNAP